MLLSKKILTILLVVLLLVTPVSAHQWFRQSCNIYEFTNALVNYYNCNTITSTETNIAGYDCKFYDITRNDIMGNSLTFQFEGSCLVFQPFPVFLLPYTHAVFRGVMTVENPNRKIRLYGIMSHDDEKYTAVGDNWTLVVNNVKLTRFHT